MKGKILILLLSLSAPAWCYVVGNPGQPWLMMDGLLPYRNDYCSLRAGYLNDYVYSQQFQGQFTVGSEEEKPPINKISSETAQISLNFVRRLDIYGIIGTAKLQMDREVYSQNQLAWGVGSKIVMLKSANFQMGCDFKYFQTNQTPSYLVSGGIPLKLASDLMLSYQEYQAALGISYRHSIFCPYVSGTYLNAKISPSQNKFLIQIPGMEDLMDANTKTFINAKTWGMAVGGSLIMGEKGTLTIESRFINQNAIDASLEIHF